jgi:large subunit ribosomal protein L4
MKRSAVDSALLGKILDKEVSVIETLPFEKPKTKDASKLLKSIGFPASVLIGTEAYNKNAWLSVRNLPRVRMKDVKDLNAYEILRHKNLLLTRAALDKVVKERKGEVQGPGSKR